MNQRLLPRSMELTMLPVQSPLPARAVRAHALKNCLAVICAVNHLVEPELGNAAQRRLLRSQNAIKRMAKLIEEDLHAQGEAHPPRAGYVSSRRVFEAVRDRVEDLARAKRIRLTFETSSGGLQGDFEALTEALGNIVKNAIESGAVGHDVVVTSCQRGDGQLWSVRDTGSGIPRHVLVQLGTPFYTRRTGGSGLGIAVARDTFESHGGLLHLESAPGSGTTVSIWLPLAPPA